MAQIFISWQAPEFEHLPKTTDWYWAFWIIATAIAIISVLFQDVLLAILVIVGAAAVSLTSNRAPRLIQYELTSEGVRVGNALYPYATLQTYNIEDFGNASRLLIKSRKLFMTLIVIPLHGVHGDEVDVILKKYLLRERELHEPLLQRLVEFLGF